MSQSFEEMLSACQQADQNSVDNAIDGFDNWFPPDGTYTVAVADKPRFGNFVSNKDGLTHGVMNVRLQIIDGEEAGKTFESSFYGNSPFDMGSAKKVAALLNGKEAPSNYSEIMRTIGAKADGSVFTVKCSTKKGNAGREFHNVMYLEKHAQ